MENIIVMLKTLQEQLSRIETKLDKQEVDIRILKREILKDLKDIKNG